MKHMRNFTMKKFRKLEKQMYITRHFAITLEELGETAGESAKTVQREFLAEQEQV